MTNTTTFLLQTLRFSLSDGAARIAFWLRFFFYHLMPWPGFEPMSVELYQGGTFEGRFTN